MYNSNALISADPCVAARHVIGRLLDLSQIWRRVAHHPTEDKDAARCRQVRELTAATSGRH
jgi:hypothetical protein